MMTQSIAGWLGSTTLFVLAAAASPACVHAQTATGPAAAPVATSPAAATPSAAAQQTPAQRGFGDINPKLAQLTDDVLFGDIWSRPGLSRRDRSLVTVSALIAMNRPDQLRSHLQLAKDNGVTEAELLEAITHLAFYAGWPSAVTASNVARDVFSKK
jgi:4-carboxymuconolactone decarboxylase